MENKNKKINQNKKANPIATFFKTISRWAKRMFLGSSKELKEIDIYSVENIESPGKMIVKNFFSRKLASGALIFLIAMFMFVIIGPLFNPIDLSYTETLHKNIAPGLTMMSIPNELKGDIKQISSTSSFTVGLSNSGKVYTWGNTKLSSSSKGVDLKDIPTELKNEKVIYVTAGNDHAIAITESGKVIGWGESSQAQYGEDHKLTASTAIVMPSELLNGSIDVDKILQIDTGFQTNAIIMSEGKNYYWGNRAGASNFDMLKDESLVQVEFLSSAVVGINENGELVLGAAKNQFDTISTTDENGEQVFISLTEDYLKGKKVIDIAATTSSFTILTDDNKLLTVGTISDFNKEKVAMPELKQGEIIIDIVGGAKYYNVVTNKGNVYSFGDNSLGQTSKKVNKVESGGIVFATAFQNYIINSKGELTEKWGFKGYLMGTDDQGRDIASRVMNGGKMTMTIGAIAVIISSLIGIVVGCLSGYFGGWVDMLLMRITEIFSSVPFLPFALILSAVLAGSSVTETTRIFIIMVILGLLSWTGLARMIRGQVLAEREKEFVLSAKAMGVGELKIAFRHILPNIISIIIVDMTLSFAGCMLTEASLSYLGFGVRLPSPTWGNMLNGCNNETVISLYWWRWLFPSMFLLSTTVSINMIGDALRDVMDPKASSEK